MKKALRVAKAKDLTAVKNETIAYLQAAEEIEKDIYTLETSCEELEKKAQEEDRFIEDVLHSNYWYRDPDSGEQKESVDKLQNYISQRQGQIEQYRRNIRRADENVRNKYLQTNLKTDYMPKEFSAPSNGYFIRAFLISMFIVYAFAITLLVIGLRNENADIGDVSLLLIFGGWIICLIIGGIYSSIKDSQNQSEAAASENAKNRAQNQRNARENEKIKQNYITEQLKTIRGIEQEIVGFEQQITNQKALADEHTANAQYYREQIENIKKDLQPLYENRSKFYSVGIIPHDYCTMDCVYVLEQIFRNDLADTMREAILLYEERVFRGEIIRGMANIAAHIDSLSSIMSRLRMDIDRVGRDVALMRDDIEQANQKNREFADEIKKSTNALYEETQTHRYALEALDNSSRKLIGYVEQDRRSLDELTKSTRKIADYIDDNY